jgi:lipoate-protein ligase A
MESNKMELSEILGEDYEVVDSGYQLGQYNMDFDLDRTNKLIAGDAKPIFRIYAWRPWALSLGFNQKETDIDKGKCAELGFNIVRRPTGGRGVLHANELTYSIVCKIPKDKTHHDLYKDIHIFLLDKLKRLNIPDLDFEKSQPNFRENYKHGDISASCFASSARWEIECQGKKLIGSAQRMFGDVLLQHGSILLGAGHELLSQVLNADDEKKERLRQFTLDHSITISEALGREVKYEELASIMMDNK